MSQSPVCESVSLVAPPIHDSDEGAYLAMFKVLSHTIRFQMVFLNRQTDIELCVCQLEHHFDLTQPTISHHLKILRDAGLLRSTYDGTRVHHSLDPSAFARACDFLELFSVGKKSN